MFKEHQEVLITVVVGVLLILFLVSVFILSMVRYKHRITTDRKERLAMEKEFENILLQARIEVQELAFSDVSKEIHDNIGQLLSTVKMLLNITVKDTLEPGDALLTANETLASAITELRALSKSLSKEWLTQFDLIENLKAEAARLNSAKTIRVQVSSAGHMTIDSDQQIILFRVIQEALQNAIKHANAQLIEIKILSSETLITVNIQDDGVGFDLNHSCEGMGIANMKQRVAHIGGSIHWQCNNRGCTVQVLLPVSA